MIGRALAVRLLSQETRFLVHTERNVLRDRGLAGAVRWNAMLLNAWVRERLSRRRYVQLDAATASRARRSDTVFVFGSGGSLNELRAGEWTHFARHDVFGFNAFHYEQWIPVDFHLLRVGIYGSLRWRPYAEEVGRTLATNPNFKSTIYVLQTEYLGQFGNQMAGFGFLPRGARLLRYHTARGDGTPHRELERGMRHSGGTLADAVNVAYALGWRHIVLVGVDLYDSRYFYLPVDQTATLNQDEGTVVANEYNVLRGTRYDHTHHTVRLGIVDVMERWARQFDREGVRLSVYNPRSLLAEVLPVYQRPPGTG